MLFFFKKKYYFSRVKNSRVNLLKNKIIVDYEFVKQL